MTFSAMFSKESDFSKPVQAMAGLQKKRAEPSLAFTGSSRADLAAWRAKLLAAIKKALGVFPAKVPLNAEIVERKAFPGYVREKVVIDTERCMAMPMWVCSPRQRHASRRFPALLCGHGPGPGKDPLVGLRNGKECLEYHKTIALQLAGQGYIAAVPDWRLYGERAEPVQRRGAPAAPAQLNAMISKRGHTLTGLNVWDGMRALDYLASRKDVAADRIGCLGVCLGAFIAALLALLDSRVKAVGLSLYLGTEQGKILTSDGRGATMEALPGFAWLASAADVAGLLAPRPLLLQSGEYDFHLSPPAALRDFRQVKKIYAAAGAAANLEHDFFDGSYEINVPPLISFFDRRLRA